MKNLEEAPVITDKIAEKFNEYVDLFSFSEEELAKKKILDVGCDRGEFVRYVRDVIGNKGAYGVEQRSNVEWAGGKDGIFEADGLDMPFDDNTFELVVAKHYLSEYFVQGEEKVRQGLDELLRVLKQEGKLVADVITAEELEKIERTELEKAWIKESKENEDKHKKRVASANYFKEYLKEIEQKGFDVNFEKKDEMFTILTIIKNA